MTQVATDPSVYNPAAVKYWKKLYSTIYTSMSEIDYTSQFGFRKQATVQLLVFNHRLYELYMTR